MRVHITMANITLIMVGMPDTLTVIGAIAVVVTFIMFAGRGIMDSGFGFVDNTGCAKGALAIQT